MFLTVSVYVQEKDKGRDMEEQGGSVGKRRRKGRANRWRE
jgi:hypothetical protein